MNRVWAEIDLNALKNNVELSARTVGGDVGIIAVVKADAYGHGAVEISRVLEQIPQVSMLGVSSMEEALELRESGVSAPVLVLGAVPGAMVEQSVKADITLSIFTSDCLKSLSSSAAKNGKQVGFHLKIDTGMGRFGAEEDEAAALARQAREMKSLRLDGVFTHLAYSSAPEKEPTLGQIDRFNRAVSTLENCGAAAAQKHMANSAAVQRFPESFGNAVRPGIMLYGSSFEKKGLEPVMSIKTSVAHIRRVEAGKPIGYGGTFVTKKPSVLATVPAGYKDGYFRALSNRANVSVRGAAAPVAGKVCMDSTTVDVTDIPGVCVGDEVVLFGDGRVSVDDVAAWAGTVPYEVMTVMGGKTVRKVFKPS